MISWQAKSLEKVLGVANFKSEATKEFLERLRGDKFNKPPKHFYKKYQINHFIVQNKRCFTMKSTDNPKKHIVFYHGGAYKYSVAKLHWGLMDSVLSAIKCAVTLVDYPLSTDSTCIDTISMVTKAYQTQFKGSDQEIILMGDSAGGGLSLALAQVLKNKKVKPLPEKLVLISPWLDVSMDYDLTKELDKADKMLNKALLTENGKSYAGELDVKDFRCSPLYGDVADLGEIALFIGTNDMLINDAVRFKEKIDQVGGRLDYYEYKDMQHDWIEFPIPEAKDAIKKIIAFIEK